VASIPVPTSVHHKGKDRVLNANEGPMAASRYDLGDSVLHGKKVREKSGGWGKYRKGGDGQRGLSIGH